MKFNFELPEKEGQKDWDKEAQRVLKEFREENKHLSKSAKGILGQNLMAKIAGEIAKVEVQDADDAKTFAQQLLIELDRSSPSTSKEKESEGLGDPAHNYLEEYLHPEEKEDAA